jgi:hypothetical protein
VLALGNEKCLKEWTQRMGIAFTKRFHQEVFVDFDFIFNCDFIPLPVSHSIKFSFLPSPLFCGHRARAQDRVAHWRANDQELSDRHASVAVR